MTSPTSTYKVEALGLSNIFIRLTFNSLTPANWTPAGQIRLFLPKKPRIWFWPSSLHTFHITPQRWHSSPQLHFYYNDSQIYITKPNQPLKLHSCPSNGPWAAPLGCPTGASNCLIFGFTHTSGCFLRSVPDRSECPNQSLWILKQGLCPGFLCVFYSIWHKNSHLVNTD